MRTSRSALLAVGAALCVAGLVLGGGPARAASGGTVEHWGAYGTGGKPYDKDLSPVAVSLPGSVVQVASSNSTEYALLANGSLYAWGLGEHGQLGDGQLTNSPATAVKVTFPAGVKIAFLPTDVMPYDTAFAVDTTGRAWGWGQNTQGDLCLGNAKQHSTPVRLPFTDVTTLAGGANHASYDDGGTLYSCGGNTQGALGDGSTKSSAKPVQVSGLNGASVTELVGSWNNEGALLANGDYYDWGYNASGQLGDGTTGAAATAPVQVPLPAAVAQVALGGSAATNGQTLALLASGALYAWGSDSACQLGDGRTADEPSPERISPPAGVTYHLLATGGDTSYGVSASGEVYAWGDSADGQVGDGTKTTAPQPVAVLAGVTQLSSTSANIVAGTSGS